MISEIITEEIVEQSVRCRSRFCVLANILRKNFPNVTFFVQPDFASGDVRMYRNDNEFIGGFALTTQQAEIANDFDNNENVADRKITITDEQIAAINVAIATPVGKGQYVPLDDCE